MTKYLVLLRGINVGGNAIIKMVDLRAHLESEGYLNVKTYIQSGNVILDSEKDIEKLSIDLEKSLSKQYKLDLKVVTLTHQHLQRVVENAPEWWGKSPDSRHYTLFVRKPLTSAEVMKSMPEPRLNVDLVEAGEGVIYHSAVIKQITKSSLNKIIGTPVYKQLTIRNYNTTVKLLKMMNEE